MITNPIGNPKVAILASVLMGALTVTVFMLRPGKGGLPADPASFEHRGVLPAGAPDGPHAAWLATGKVAVQADRRLDASHAAVLDAVRASLQRNDLASARVLLGAEQTLYKDDPRLIALQSELQAREGGVNRALPPGHMVEAPATLHPHRFASRSSSPMEHAHRVLALSHERAGRPPQYARSTWTPEVESASGTSNKPEESRSIPASPQLAIASPVLAQPAAEVSASAQSVALPPPATHVVQTTQSDPMRAPTPTVSTQAPKTRAEVRMEVERARSDGALPRFGNPDPAGPGGAPSRTAHAVALDW